MLLLTDQTGYTLKLPAPARRIVSLVPSQTELLADLCLDDEVVGITKFCVHPDRWFRSKKRIGGTKNPHLDQIIALQPDLIIANKEENLEGHVVALREHFPVYTSDVSGIKENNEMIGHIGLLTNKEATAKELIGKIDRAFQAARYPNEELLPTALYFVWRKPWLSVGGDTFIHEMMKWAGFNNLLSGQSRYPEVDLQNWPGPNPEYILLSSEPYPFAELHIAEVQAAFPHSKILLVDGESFSWYGSRVVKSMEYFSSLRDRI